MSQNGHGQTIMGSGLPDLAVHKVIDMPVVPPFVWPDARVHEGMMQYAQRPPSRELFADANLISALLVGGDETASWLRELIQGDLRRRVIVVLVVYPAGPTQEVHLRGVRTMLGFRKNEATTLEVRVLPMHAFGVDMQTKLPATVIQGVNESTSKTVISIGSVGDAGCDTLVVGSFNAVFHPDNALRDAWWKWFEYIRNRAAPLSDDTLTIPQLAPAKWDPEAANLWLQYVKVCEVRRPSMTDRLIVHMHSGEVTVDSEGERVQSWDEGVTALDPLAHILQEVYSSGWLVTINEATRIKPLSVPVKAALLGQQSEKSVGAVTQRQSFTLKVLDENVSKSIEKCRKVTDVMELLTLQLSHSVRWIPEAAKVLLEKELEARNQEGQKELEKALGGDVNSFVSRRSDAIRKDLTEMYQQLGQGKVVPADRLDSILEDVRERLRKALATRITPRAAYNNIAAPDLTAHAPAENWDQPLLLLVQAAKTLRESLTDPYFPRRLSKLAFTNEEFERACDVFGDVVLTKPDIVQAKHDLLHLEELVASDDSARERCHAVWAIIKGQRA